MGFPTEMPKAPIRIIGAKVKEIKVETMRLTKEKVITVMKMIKVDPMFRLKIRKLLLGMVKVIWRELKICCRR